MSVPMHIELNAEDAEQVRQLAVSLQQTPETVADEIVANGMLMVRRYANLKNRAKDADVPRAIALLNRMGNNNPPDPGDELPEDLQYLVKQRR